MIDETADQILARIKSHRIGQICATYFWGDASPLNCWDSFRPDVVPAYLDRMSADGFNTVILLLPLSLPVLEAERPDLHAKFLNHLNLIFRECRQRGMYLIFRLLYLWDMFPINIDRPLRAFRLYADTEERVATLDYLKRLERIAAHHQNFLFGFITWEDLLGYFLVRAPKGSEEMRADAASHLGWAGPCECSDGSGDVITRVPEEGSLHLGEYFHFADQKFLQLFERIHGVFPLLTAEVRVDTTPYGADTAQNHHNHDRMHDLGPTVVGTYYAPYMGQMNSGEKISATGAFTSFVNVHCNVQRNAKRKILFFVDQLLLHIEQKEFKHFAWMDQEQKMAFVEMAAPFLLQSGVGYACWAFRDYLFQRIGNASFCCGREYWEASENCRFDDGVMTCHAPASFSQQLRTQNSETLVRFNNKGVLYLDGALSPDGCLEVLTAQGRVSFTVADLNAHGPVFREIHLSGPVLSLEVTSGSATLSHISFGTQVCSTGSYGLDFKPHPSLASYLRLNILLNQQRTPLRNSLKVQLLSSWARCKAKLSLWAKTS